MDWVARITVFCFAASYSVGLALEVTRFWFRSGIRGAVMIGFTIAGLFAHTLYLAVRAGETPAIPLSSAFDWYLLAAWLLAASYLYLTLNHRQAALGVFFLPLVLGLIGAAQLADRSPFPQQPASYAWGMLHGVFLLLGTVTAAVGAGGGLMYLVQDRRVRLKLPPPQGVRLPSLEWLARLAGRSVIAAVLLCGLGLLAGVILNFVNRRHAMDSLSWGDPVVWSSGVLFGCMAVALGLTYRSPDAHSGRRVAWLTLLNFGLLLVVLAFSLFAPTGHAPPRSIGPATSTALPASSAAAGTSAADDGREVARAGKTARQSATGRRY